MDKITVDFLRSGTCIPCAGQLRVFTRKWPEGMEVTISNAIRALEFNLSIDWVIRELLPHFAWIAFKEAIAPPRIIYEKAVDAAQIKYRESPDINWAASTEARTVASEIVDAAQIKYYEEDIAPALAAYRKAEARAWVKVVKSHQERIKGGK